MGARRDFGHHPAERTVRLGLADHRLGQNFPAGIDQRGGAVVARRFEGKDQGHGAKAFA